MKWYTKASSRILRGVTLVLLPLGLVVYVLYEATVLVQQWLLPWESHLPAGKILGFGMLTLISLGLILLTCYLVGVLTENPKLKPLFTFIENNLLVYIPGYTILKSSTQEAMGGDDAGKAVLVADGETWKLGVEIDRQENGFCTVFFPDPPDGKSGEVLLMPESKLKRLNIPISKLMLMVRNYGKGGASQLLDLPEEHNPQIPK